MHTHGCCTGIYFPSPPSLSLVFREANMKCTLIPGFYIQFKIIWISLLIRIVWITLYDSELHCKIHHYSCSFSIHYTITIDKLWVTDHIWNLKILKTMFRMPIGVVFRGVAMWGPLLFLIYIYGINKVDRSLSGF